MSSIYRQKDLAVLYRNHPLREETILERLRRDRGGDVTITEQDLGEDYATEITDQNHLGGWAFSRELGIKAGISRGCSVLDLGCGLGGSARYLAFTYGCSVMGIDLLEERCNAATVLSRLVGLDHLVHIICGDLMTMEVHPGIADVIWGQGAWSHVQDKNTLVHRWAKALRVSGRFAIEDCFLKREPASTREEDDWCALQRIWHADVVSIDSWKSALGGAGHRADVIEDLSDAVASYFQRLQTTLGQNANSISPEEKASWDLAARLSAGGLLGYFRIVTRKY